MTNRIIPMKVMIPARIRTASNPENAKEKLGTVGLGPVDVVEMAANREKMKKNIVITIMMGIMISIKLAAIPILLPGSSDILVPIIYLLGF